MQSLRHEDKMDEILSEEDCVKEKLTCYLVQN